MRMILFDLKPKMTFYSPYGCVGSPVSSGLAGRMQVKQGLSTVYLQLHLFLVEESLSNVLNSIRINGTTLSTLNNNTLNNNTLNYQIIIIIIMSSNARRIRRPNNKYSSDLRMNNSKSKSSNLEDEESAFSLENLKVPKQTYGQLQQSSSSRSKGTSKILFYVLVGATIVLVIRTAPVLFSKTVTTSTFTVASTNGFGSSIVSLLRNGKKDIKSNQMEPKPGEYAPISNGETSILPLTTLRRPPTDEYHIFILGPDTFLPTIRLSNLLMGLFESSDVFLAVTSWSVVGGEYLTRHMNEWVPNNKTITSLVVDDTDVTHLVREFRSLYHQLFFFVLLTDATKDVCEAPPIPNSIVCIDPSTVTHTNEINHGVETTIAALVTTIQEKVPFWSQVHFPIVEALRRMNGMEEMLLQMQDRPSSSNEIKYGVYGGIKA